MEITKESESSVYNVEFKGNNYSVTITSYINMGYTDTYVLGEDGEEVDSELASELLELVLEHSKIG